MNIFFRNRSFLTIFLLLSTNLCIATTSVIQIKVDSDARCSSLATNSILQARDTSYGVGGDGFDQVSGAQSHIFKYKLTTVGSTSNNRIEWKVTTPDPNAIPTTAQRVNFIILRLAGSNGSIAAYYVNPGEYQDNGLTTTASITGVSFCYGLSQPTSAKLPSCNSLGFDCALPTGVQARLITTFDEPTGDENWRVKTCACDPQPGQEQFTECDPNLPAGSAGACTKGPTPENPDVVGTLKFLPSSVELGLNPDSYYCTVIFGSKRCWSK
jgi:hypothetical protein